MFDKKAFTLIELMVVVLMLGVGLIGVFQTTSRSFNFLSTVKSKLTAINFARGGVEGVFTIRNTNWQRWAGKKDKCWLKLNPLFDDDGKCENDTWFLSGSYILGITGEQQYFYLEKNDNILKLTGNLISTDWKYLLCRDQNDGLIKSCTDKASRPNDYFSPELYFRQVRGGYLLDKNENIIKTNDCNDGNSDCANGMTLEKNFCVDVVYFNGSKKNVTFCSVITNFKK